jgi:hypothetical protein
LVEGCEQARGLAALADVLFHEERRVAPLPAVAPEVVADGCSPTSAGLQPLVVHVALRGVLPRPTIIKTDGQVLGIGCEVGGLDDLGAIGQLVGGVEQVQGTLDVLGHFRVAGAGHP